MKLIQRNDVQKVLSTPLSELTAFAQKKPTKAFTIMVVDDSLTVRKSEVWGRVQNPAIVKESMGSGSIDC